MYLIVGLGNPGLKYSYTRHNIGFIVIDKIAQYLKAEKYVSENNYLYTEAFYKDKQVVLMKPLTYMNASGKAVKAFYDKYEVKQENILIVFDDINLDFGVLRMRPSGSDGGQNGIKSVIYEMETDEIQRLRVGVWNETEFEKTKTDDGYNLADFVLSDFTDEETKHLDKITIAAMEAVFCFVESGIKESMNKHNKRVLENKDITGENNN